ncbi:MAG: hypothetical protein HAW59_04750, partial [Betaproteobacteria bacterium]|nr:hypothetical protein [Betaproteobacteria bacterium]
EYWRNGLAFYAVEPKIVNEVEPVSTIGENRKPDGALLARIWASLWRKRDWQRMWFLGDKNLEIDPI